MGSHFQQIYQNGVANFRIFGVSRDSKWEDSRLWRGQRHIPSKHLPKYPPPLPLNPRTRARAPLPWLNSDSFLPRPVIMIMSGIINTKFDRRLEPLTVDLSIITFCVQEPIVLVRVRSRTRASISLFGDTFLVFWPSQLKKKQNKLRL